MSQQYEDWLAELDNLRDYIARGLHPYTKQLPVEDGGGASMYLLNIEIEDLLGRRALISRMIREVIEGLGLGNIEREEAREETAMLLSYNRMHSHLDSLLGENLNCEPLDEMEIEGDYAPNHSLTWMRNLLDRVGMAWVKENSPSERDVAEARETWKYVSTSDLTTYVKQTAYWDRSSLAELKRRRTMKLDRMALNYAGQWPELVDDWKRLVFYSGIRAAGETYYRSHEEHVQELHAKVFGELVPDLRHLP